MKRLMVLSLVLFAAGPAHAQFEKALGGLPGAEPKKLADVAKVTVTVEPKVARRGQTVTWKLTVDVIPGWHTYASKQLDLKAQTQVNSFKFPSNGEVIFVGELVDPANSIKIAEPDLDVKEMITFEGKAAWERKLVVSPDAAHGVKKVMVQATILACEKACFREKITTNVDLTVSDEPPVPVEAQFADAVKQATTVPPVSAQDKAAKAPPPVASVETEPTNPDYKKTLEGILAKMPHEPVPSNAGLGAFLLTAVFWGAISLVTPCVFPMIPITVSFFLKQSEKNHTSPVLLALVYCGTIVAVLGIGALTLLGFFRALSVNPWMNFFLGALFVVLALSLFGMFDLTLPSSFTRFTSSREGRGGVIGTVFMALTFTIVSFTCVAPFLGGFGGMASSGQFRPWELVLGAIAFSGTFAAPFFVLALFPSLLKKLPKSGGWLHSVKVVMGFLELAAALKFFRAGELIFRSKPEFFTYDLVLGMWVVLSVLCGLYLLNVIRIGHDEPAESVGVPRFLTGFVFVSLGLYMLPALFAVNAEGEKQRPRGTIYAWIDSFLLPEPREGQVGGLQWTGDLKRALDDARALAAGTGKPQYVFVDFTGETCTNCKLNEEGVFTKKEIRDLFQPFRLVQLYTDKVPDKFYPPVERSKFKDTSRQQADAQLNQWFQDQAFKNQQLPLYVILRPTPEGPIERVGEYEEGLINNVAAFAEFLKKPFQGDTSARAHAGK